MDLAGDVGVTQAIAKKVGRSFGDCCAMYQLLKEHEKLGKASVVVENGIRFTKCPPAYARGVWSKSRY